MPRKKYFLSSDPPSEADANHEIPITSSEKDDSSATRERSTRESPRNPAPNSTQWMSAYSCELPSTSTNNYSTTRTDQENFRRIDDVVDKVLSMQSEITTFAGSRSDKKYLYLEDILVRYLVSLDGIATNNNEDLKYKRKEAVTIIQQHIDLLDSRTKKRKKISFKTNDLENSHKEEEREGATALDTSKSDQTPRTPERKVPFHLSPNRYDKFVPTQKTYYIPNNASDDEEGPSPYPAQFSSFPLKLRHWDDVHYKNLDNDTDSDEF